MLAESIADFKLSIHKPNKEGKGENANNHFAVQAITPIARKDIVPTIFLCGHDNDPYHIGANNCQIFNTYYLFLRFTTLRSCSFDNN